MATSGPTRWPPFSPDTPTPLVAPLSVQAKIPLEAWESAFALCSTYQHDPSVHIKVQGLVGILLSSPPPRVSPTLISRVLQVGGLRTGHPGALRVTCVTLC